MFQENVLISFLRKFDAYPFVVKMDGKEYQIGEGKPVFVVKFHKMIPMADLAASTSIVLGEAYMDGTLEMRGTYTMRWTISLGKWENSQQMKPH